MRCHKKLLVSLFVLGLSCFNTSAQAAEGTKQEQLRGAITPERSWWDLKHYHLSLTVDPQEKRISGSNVISFKTLRPGRRMQIDLQKPLKITRVLHSQTDLEFERDGNVYWIQFKEQLAGGVEDQIQVFYEGTPIVSKNPPWSGGITWQRDTQGNHFIASTAQGIGASIWWPNKDHGYDEPDRGMKISLTVPENLTGVSNGRLVQTDENKGAGTKTFHWVVTNPINNYCVNINIGDYISFSEKYQGEGGDLDMQYWVLSHQRELAMKHFKEVPRTLAAFEHWFGKYPFYEDSYKLVVVPYTGMEHQSSVTYGNGFRNGYRGKDQSGTGIGLKFDFIIVHESGHEWFGNNISMVDVADMWIHESFTNYSENLFVEYHFSKKEAEDYVIGCRKGIRNERPIIGTYDLNRSGSGDMYQKGGNMLHTIRHSINDDKKWLRILRGLNSEFWHQTVTTKQVEDYISQESGIDFNTFFDQYLRTANIPTLKYQIDRCNLHYYFDDAVAGLTFPIRVTIDGKEVELTPTDRPQTILQNSAIVDFKVNRNFYLMSEPDNTLGQAMASESLVDSSRCRSGRSIVRTVARALRRLRLPKQ